MSITKEEQKDSLTLIIVLLLDLWSKKAKHNATRDGLKGKKITVNVEQFM